MSEEMDLKRIIKIIGRHKKFIITITVAAAIIAGGISLLLPKEYRSSLILEVGKLYLSSTSWINEIQLIENPEAVAAILESDGIINEVREKLRLDIPLEDFRGQLEVNTLGEKTAYLPVLEIACDSQSPQESVDVLNALADKIVRRHAQKYRLYRDALERSVKYTGEEISAIEKIISAQDQYKQLSQKYIDKGEVTAEDFSRELNELDASAQSAVDLLYLQGSALGAKNHITGLTRFQAEMDLRVGEDQKAIADLRMQIVDFTTRLDLSSPTEIRSPAVLPEIPVKPKKRMIVIIGLVLGLLGSSLIAIFREYINE
jgi:capsular polysaccharide biosynthesis protein